MSADYLSSLVYLQSSGYHIVCLLDLHPGFSVSRRPTRRLSFGEVDLLRGAAGLRITGQRTNEGRDFLDNVRSLTWAGLDQAAGRKQLDGVADGVTRGVVLFHELNLGAKSAATRYHASFDLGAQILSDLPVHRLSHDLSPKIPINLMSWLAGSMLIIPMRPVIQIFGLPPVFCASLLVPIVPEVGMTGTA